MSKLDLGWMRVFRETADRRSFSAAATALGLSQPAVSYQVRRIEEQLGTELLDRGARGVELTVAGRRLYDIVGQCVDGLDALARETAGRRNRPVVRLRTDYAFSSYWLIPRMEAFRLAHPQIDIQIVAAQRFQPDDMEREDVAVIFADADRQAPNATMLVEEEVVPVCSPQVFEQLQQSGGGAKAIAGARLINLDADSRAPWFDWPAYFSGCGVERRSQGGQGDLSFNTYSLVVQAALENQGVALGWTGLIETYVRLKFLVPAGPPLRSVGRGYVLLPPSAPNPQTEAFMRWLKAEASPNG